MPQEELRAKWGGRNGVGEACKYLEGRGYVLTASWDWKVPGHITKPSEEDVEAATFLVTEWDWFVYG